MHKGTFPRANRSARKRTLVHRRAETLRVEKIGALLYPVLVAVMVAVNKSESKLNDIPQAAYITCVVNTRCRVKATRRVKLHS